MREKKRGRESCYKRRKETRCERRRGRNKRNEENEKRDKVKASFGNRICRAWERNEEGNEDDSRSLI